jgi:hypothetical protein
LLSQSHRAVQVRRPSCGNFPDGENAPTRQVVQEHTTTAKLATTVGRQGRTNLQARHGSQFAFNKMMAMCSGWRVGWADWNLTWIQSPLVNVDRATEHSLTHRISWP